MKLGILFYFIYLLSGKDSEKVETALWHHLHAIARLHHSDYAAKGVSVILYGRKKKL